jgi:hypothetical protein
MLVGEFGAEADTPQARAQRHVDMWEAIRAFPQYVLGGAPHVWTTEALSRPTRSGASRMVTLNPWTVRSLC